MVIYQGDGMNDSEFSQQLYEIINSDQLYGIITSQGIKRTQEKETELGIKILHGEHVISDNLSDEQYKIFSTIIKKHNTDLKAKPEPLPVYELYAAKLADKRTVEIDIFYDSVLDEAEKGKSIPSHIVKSLLKAMGRPNYTDKREQLLFVLYFIEAEQINRGGTYRSAVIRYCKDLQNRESENYYETTLKIMDDNSVYNKILKDKSRLFK